MAIRLDRLVSDMGQASGGLRIGDLVGRREGLRADLAADLDVARPRFAGMSAADIRLGGAGTVALADGVLTFVPSASSTIEGAAIDLGAVRLPGRTHLVVNTEDGRPLRFGTVAGTFEGAVVAAPLDLAAAAEPVEIGRAHV